jgi:tRNA (adenine22-N1)-methyltransferase
MRIKAVTRLIEKDSVVVDIGSDHALLAINLLKNGIAKHVYNIELNKLPYENTIKNLTDAGVIDKTTNILADGLQTKLIKSEIDYCVISGIGAHNIINILENANKSIKIKNYIFVPHSNPNLLKNYLIEHNFRIKHEENINQRGYSYILMLVF